MLRGLVTACLFAGASLFSFAAAQAADAIGNVAAVVGAPSASGPGGDRQLKSGSELYENDRIIVAGEGNAQIVLNDGTRLVVGPDSSLLLDSYVASGGGKAEKVGLKALRGTYRFISGKSPKSAYKIITASATIGIRGTGFDYWVKKKTGVVVLKGSVLMRGLKKGRVQVDQGCEMGEADVNYAQQLKGNKKKESINKNLPFLLDQSSLRAAFRLDIGQCKLQRALYNPGGKLGAPEEPVQTFQSIDNGNFTTGGGSCTTAGSC